MCQWTFILRGNVPMVTGLRFAFVADYRCALVAGILSPESEGETGLSAALLFLRLRRPSACPPHGGESRAALCCRVALRFCLPLHSQKKGVEL